MSLGNWLANQILLEEKKITKVVAIYPGRFQPMGKHHAKTYNWLKSKFKDAYVATSGKVALPKSPFSFSEKKKIINSHGISNVVQVKNPYKAEEILKKYDPETTAAVFMVGKKDAQRLGGKFFRPWKGKADVGYKEGAYTIIAPHVSMNVPGYGEMSGTAIRKALGDKDLEKKNKVKIFKGIFGHTKNYDLVVNKLESLNETMEKFFGDSNLRKIIEEGSTTLPGQRDVDDGPRYFYGTQKSYREDTKKMAFRLGMDVLNYLVPEEEFFQHGTAYPDGPTSGVSYFPAGIPATGKKDVYAGTNYMQDRVGKDAYNRWKRWAKYLAQQSGHEFVQFLGADKSVKQTKEEPISQSKEMSKIKNALKKQKLGKKSSFPKDIKVNTLDENLGQWIVRQILAEGGAYGHMSHPFDDKGLTFGDFKNIIDLGLRGNLDLEKACKSLVLGKP